LQVEPLSSSERLRGHHLVSGFAAQRIVKLPDDVIHAAARQPLTRPLLASSAGFYPKAAGHLARRPVGIDQTIFMSSGLKNSHSPNVTCHSTSALAALVIDKTARSSVPISGSSVAAAWPADAATGLNPLQATTTL
jgi:hypothetical protein